MNARDEKVTRKKHARAARQSEEERPPSLRTNSRYCADDREHGDGPPYGVEHIQVEQTCRHFIDRATKDPQIECLLNPFQ
jgi:hypothetical protein